MAHNAVLKFKDENGSEVIIRTSTVSKLEVIASKSCNYETGRFKVIVHQIGVTPTVILCKDLEEKTDIVNSIEYFMHYES
jgi:hypothetical protein